MIRSLIRNTRLHRKIVRNINSNSFYRKEVSVINYCTSDSNKKLDTNYISNDGKIKVRELLNDLKKLDTSLTSNDGKIKINEIINGLQKSVINSKSNKEIINGLQK